ncbi:MAG: vWA domain-containing protein, partial [Nocardioides sp.]
MTTRRRTARRLAAGAAAGAALVLSLATGAHAVDGAIVNVERTSDGLEVSVDVPADSQVDLAGVAATVEGVDYPAEAFRLSDGDSRVRRTTVLVIDTSDSMTGRRFAAAKDAASRFLDVVPPDVLVGIVGFSSTVETALEPTTDRDAARAVLDTLSLSRGTRLYEAVVASLALAGDEGQGSLLVLSDGADTSATPLTDVIAALAETQVVVDVVALERGNRATGALGRLTGETGELISADSASLASAFSEEAAILARQVGVRISVPSDTASGQVSVTVVLPSSSGDVTASSTVMAIAGATPSTDPGLPSVPVETSPSSSASLPDWTIYVGIGVFGVGLAVALAQLVPAKPMPMSAEQRVST